MQRQWQGKRYWLVGASEGLGKSLAEVMSRAGVELVLSARSEDKLRELSDALPGKSSVVPVDVADDESVAQAAKAAGELDGMVYLAGVYWPMKAGEWDAEKAAAMVDVNFTGAVRVLGHIMPTFVERDRGHIVLTGSLSGFRGLPGTIGYGASKAGLMYLAEGMAMDLRDTGVRVQLVNPGFVKTRLTEKNDFKMPFIMEPEAAAREYFEHMQNDDFSRNFPWGFSMLFRSSRFYPSWLYRSVFR